MVSETLTEKLILMSLPALILVVVEDGLRDYINFAPKALIAQALILVVVEDGLRESWKSQNISIVPGLNPCCCGRWSQRPG